MKTSLLTLILFLLLLPIHIMAQTQTGYVKTKGRLGTGGKVIAGKRLSGASVVLKGGNAVVSGANGTFSLKVPSKQFYLQNVKKNGYTLADPDVLKKQYAYSTNPLVVVMEVPETQNEDLLNAQRKIRRNLERQLRVRENELETLKEEHRITVAEYQAKLQDIYSQQEKDEQLIKEMAERYSRIDYDQLNEFDLKVSELILNGELSRADSLLNSKGDLTSAAADYQQLKGQNDAMQEELYKRRAVEKYSLEELAERCQKKSEIFKLQYENDSAAYYKELRAGLDTMNVEWQLEAAELLNLYLAHYDKALVYARRALNNAVRKYGEKDEAVAACCLMMGVIYDYQGDYPKALEYYQAALEIELLVYGENHPIVATNYFDMGCSYYAQGDLPKGMEFFKKALAIWVPICGERHPRVNSCYNNLGTFHYLQGEYDEAFGYYLKASRLEQADAMVMTAYMYAGAKGTDHDMEQALYWADKAMETAPNVPNVYDTKGDIAIMNGDIVTGKEMWKKLLSIDPQFVQKTPSNLAKVVDLENDEDIYLKMIELGDSINSPLHLGKIYLKQGKEAMARKYYEMAAKNGNEQALVALKLTFNK